MTETILRERLQLLKQQQEYFSSAYAGAIQECEYWLGQLQDVPTVADLFPGAQVVEHSPAALPTEGTS